MTTKQREELPTLTDAQRFVLQWIADNGGKFRKPYRKPNFWLETRLPLKDKKRFRDPTFQLLERLGCLKNVGDAPYGYRAVWQITARGRAVLEAEVCAYEAAIAE